MQPRLSHILISAAFVLTTLFGVALVVEHLSKGKESKAEQQSHVDQGVADAHQSQAKDSDAKVADLQTKLDTKAKDLDRLLAERDALRRKLLSAQTPSHDPISPGASPVEPVSDPRDAVISQDDEVIRSQGSVIEGQKAQITQLTISRDEWKSSFEAERRRSAGLEIALDAQKHVSNANQWKGGLKGLAVGIVLGYAGAKR